VEGLVKQVLFETKLKRVAEFMIPLDRRWDDYFGNEFIKQYIAVMLQLTSTIQNSSDDVFSYPPDNHHSSDVVCWRRAGTKRPLTDGLSDENE